MKKEIKELTECSTLEELFETWQAKQVEEVNKLSEAIHNSPEKICVSEIFIKEHYKKKGNTISSHFIQFFDKDNCKNCSENKDFLTLKHCCLSSLRGLRNLGNLSELFIEDMGKDPGILEIFSIPSIERLKLFVPREYEQERTDWYLRSLKVNLPMLQWLELEMPAHEFHIETLEGLELRRFGVTSKRFEL